MTIKLKTPYYLIDEKKLLKNMRKMKLVRDISGARSLLALKCFSTWSVFGLMSEYMDGTTSSSLYEARLGREKFGKEVHAYSVAYLDDDIEEIKKYSDKIIFNSVTQLKRHYKSVRGYKLGLRVNPGFSYSHFDLADPARMYSRLGVVDKKEVEKSAGLISGIMFHFNCENADFSDFAKNLDKIGSLYGDILKRLEWISLGGGIFFTAKDYPIDKFAAKLKEFADAYGIQVYLEPGESSITGAGELVTTVLDVVHNDMDIAIVDTSIEAHMLDLLIYRLEAKIDETKPGGFKYMIAGRSCLAGDIFGTYGFDRKLKPGSVIRIADAAGYSMVKKNWFNGLSMPSIAVKRLDGTIETVRSFTYKDFKGSLS
jgi:carboxynorspermidine decarboxylase